MIISIKIDRRAEKSERGGVRRSLTDDVGEVHEPPLRWQDVARQRNRHTAAFVPLFSLCGRRDPAFQITRKGGKGLIVDLFEDVDGQGLADLRDTAQLIGVEKF